MWPTSEAPFRWCGVRGQPARLALSPQAPDGRPAPDRVRLIASMLVALLIGMVIGAGALAVIAA
jgi:hypothetical protein